MENLIQEITDKVTVFKKKKENNRWKANLSKVITIVVSSSIPVILGLELQLLSLKAKELTIILGALISINEGIALYFKFEKNWIRYLDTENSLKALLLEIDILNRKETTDLEKYIHQKYQNILNKQNEDWNKIRGDT
ncbi:DUF4231 domain-containing protein [Fulvivirgaceae bacterium BMA10]|uniref:DUF4231 domain-containing protein n=1 Tax=Splendidivirga corallicola TaxID=3051826 RepID=A0ABT8KLA0_9BACT|nr:DUF4231 domain-containing protein [Fulvivirgaceae bacterium BMA10]